jgi:hypothetical protein
VRKPLHVVRVEAAAIDHDGQRVSRERPLREHVELSEAAEHEVNVARTERFGIE